MKHPILSLFILSSILRVCWLGFTLFTLFVCGTSSCPLPYCTLTRRCHGRGQSLTSLPSRRKLPLPLGRST